jgi:hypothetical protein
MVSGIRVALIRFSALRRGLSRQVRGWKAVVALTQTPLSGPMVALFDQLRVTRPPALELVEALEPTEIPLLLLHAAIVAAAATAMATMTGFGKPRMRLVS